MGSSEDDSCRTPSILPDNLSMIFVSSVEDVDDDDSAYLDDANEVTVEGRLNNPESGEAESNSEQRPKRTQKRKKNEWKREERKRKRNSGKSYVTRKGKIIAEKQFNNVDCKCRKNCFTKITEQARQNIFETFWKLGASSPQNVFICDLVKRVVPERHRPRTGVRNRKSSNKFYLNIGGERKPVCRKYFLETLQISDGRMTRALQKVKIDDSLGNDKRRSKKDKTTSNKKMAQVKDHNSSFLNIRVMYNLYKEHMERQGCQPIEERIYRRNFNNDFNTQIHAPNKHTFDIFSKKTKILNKCRGEKDNLKKIKLEIEY